MRDNILVVGGYGQVGQVVATRLATRFPGRVIVAGRNMARAAALANTTQGRIAPLQLDLADVPGCVSALDNVQLAIVCLEQNNVAFARACLERGIHYIDISASYHILQQIETFDDLARQHGASAILSVGLAPGLTNLLARYLNDLLDTTETIIGTALGGACEACRWYLRDCAVDRR
ncbi:MAG: hypothetical protein KatS3mg057_1625 [Herpetosiphonaceae bacterium]|nr:MAG: hypothetical protein KatS3mg057_1625 [Herpetosiphonaceae bacterium]